jgi:hypothetical protein
MTEVTNAMSNVASAVAAYMQEGNGWPSANSITNIQNSLGVSLGALDATVTVGGRVASMVVRTGVITAVVSNIDTTVNNSNLVMTPSSSLTDGSIRWDWQTSNNMPAAYIPKR